MKLVPSFNTDFVIQRPKGNTVVLISVYYCEQVMVDSSAKTH